MAEITNEMVEAGLQHYSEGGCCGLADYERREVVHAILTAAENARKAPIVKPLEWADESEGLECWRARPPLGPIYTLEDDGFSSRKYHVTANQLVLGTFNSLATAKAAAQADYDQRILSDLSTPPQQDDLRKAVIEECAKVADEHTKAECSTTDGDQTSAMRLGASSIAAAIRALATRSASAGREE